MLTALFYGRYKGVCVGEENMHQAKKQGKTLMDLSSRLPERL